MPIDNTIHIISVILAPVAMITSCALLISSLQQRYVNMGDRLRAMHLERFTMLMRGGRAGDTSSYDDALAAERLGELAAQMPRILRRHRLLRDAMVLEYVAIGFYMVNMGVLAWVELEPLPLASFFSLSLFIAGTIVLFFGVIITTVEVWQSHAEIAYEMGHGTAITHRWRAGDVPAP